MALDFEALLAAADRVAASHGLSVVELDFGGGGKSRALRVFLEKDAAGRAALREQVKAGAADLPTHFADGTLNIEHLSGITHEDCEQFSRDFGTLLDVEELIPGAEYLLEVSSPGLDRKLASREDFVRFTGSLVKLSTFEPVENNRQWQGRLAAVETGEKGDEIVLDLTALRQKGKAKKATAGSVTIPFGNIEKAHLIPEF